MASTSREIHIRFVLDTRDAISPSDFVDLVKCAESYSRYLAEREAHALLEQLGLSDRERLATIQRFHHLGRRLPAPAELVEVQRGSWIVVVAISAPVILHFLKNYIEPVVREAWNESNLKSRIKSFARDKLFGGAKQKIEERAVTSRDFGNLRVVEVREGKHDSRAVETVEVRLELRRVIEASVSDQALIDEFVQQLNSGA